MQPGRQPSRYPLPPPGRAAPPCAAARPLLQRFRARPHAPAHPLLRHMPAAAPGTAGEARCPCTRALTRVPTLETPLALPCFSRCHAAAVPAMCRATRPPWCLLPPASTSSRRKKANLKLPRSVTAPAADPRCGVPLPRGCAGECCHAGNPVPAGGTSPGLRAGALCCGGGDGAGGGLPAGLFGWAAAWLGWPWPAAARCPGAPPAGPVRARPRRRRAVGLGPGRREQGTPACQHHLVAHFVGINPRPPTIPSGVVARLAGVVPSHPRSARGHVEGLCRCKGS